MFCQNCGAPDKGGVFCTDCGSKDFAATRPENPPRVEPVQQKPVQQAPVSVAPAGSSCATTLGGIAALLFLVGMVFAFFGL